VADASRVVTTVSDFAVTIGLVHVSIRKTINAIGSQHIF